MCIAPPARAAARRRRLCCRRRRCQVWKPTPPPPSSQDAREKAASALVEALIQNQQEFEAESGAEASDDDEDAAAAAAALGGARARDVGRALRRCSPLVVYAFKRLCRGLGSSRQGARQGFSLAIASLLAGTQCIAPAEAVTAIEGVLEPVGKVRMRNYLLLLSCPR